MKNESSGKPRRINRGATKCPRSISWDTDFGILAGTITDCACPYLDKSLAPKRLWISQFSIQNENRGG
jgi:hypothetical protein